MGDIFVRAKKHLLTLHLLMSKGLGEGVEAEQERDILEHLHKSMTTEERRAIDAYSEQLYKDQESLVALRQELKEVQTDLRNPHTPPDQAAQLQLLALKIYSRIAEIVIKGEQAC